MAIRRVIGGNLTSLSILVGQEYLWLMFVATLIGVPVSYWSISRWLQNFAYHIQVEAGTYLLCILMLLAMILALVIWQTHPSTRENPMESLREK